MTKFPNLVAQERVFSNLLKYLWLLLHIKPHRKLFSIFFFTFEKVGPPLTDNIYKKLCRTSRSFKITELSQKSIKNLSMYEIT